MTATGGGIGIAPNAPSWVRAGAEKVRSGLPQSGAEGGTLGTESAGPTPRAPQRVRRAAWMGCRDVYAWRGYNHIFGYNLFRYYQQVSWCSNGYGIYSWSRFRWPELNGPGWGFDGHIDSYLGGSSYRKRAFTVGQFHACFAGYCDYKAPWVNIEVTADGTYSWNTGG